MSLSTRVSIRWLPAAASEPTSTIALTLPKTHLYTDIRILLSDSSLYWGFAGHNIHIGNTGTFSHFIDSRGLVNSTDSGIFTEQADGTTLETGSMLNFDSGKVEDYEEVWLDEKREEYSGLVSVEGEGSGVIVRVGEWWQGMTFENGKFSAARWKKEGDKWNMVWGSQEEWDGGKPPVDALEGQAEGKVIAYAGKNWKIVELHTDVDV